MNRLDEQLLILRRSSGIKPDPDLPGIHNLGHDLARRPEARGQPSFAIDAATIHKFADEKGERINKRGDSPKIVDRKSLTYRAYKDTSDQYLAHKYADAKTQPEPVRPLAPNRLRTLERPTILLGRGGGGTRLASRLAQDCGLFIGNKVNLSGDCIDLVPAVYRTVQRQFRYRDPWSLSAMEPDLRTSAEAMLEEGGWPEAWGFKIPEANLILPLLQHVFPHARYIHFCRDPLQTVFRRTHMTARADNHIGRTSLIAAYDHVGRERTLILSDSPTV